MANGRCDLHGGKTPRGVASPNWKHGRYSTALPDRLIARYAAAAADPDLIVLRDDVALVDAMMADVLQRLDTGETGGLWRALREAANRFEARRRARDTAGAGESLEEMLGIIRRGGSDEGIRQEVLGHLAERRKLAEAERKRLEALQASITAGQALALIAAIVGVVRSHIRDQVVLAAIAADVAGLVGRVGVDAADEGRSPE